MGQRKLVIHALVLMGLSGAVLGLADDMQATDITAIAAVNSAMVPAGETVVAAGAAEVAAQNANGVAANPASVALVTSVDTEVIPKAQIMAVAEQLSYPLKADDCIWCETDDNRELQGGGWLCDEEEQKCHQWDNESGPVQGPKYLHDEEELIGPWYDGPCTNCCFGCGGGSFQSWPSHGAIPVVAIWRAWQQSTGRCEIPAAVLIAAKLRA